MKISAKTKISALIEAIPASIDAIASINKHFEKLRNPVLRKILASRVTIADAAKIGGCSIQEMLEKLEKIGFELTSENKLITEMDIPTDNTPAFMTGLNLMNTTTLDVRADLASGNDPFQKIMATLASMPQDNFLLIINTFEPVPLLKILENKGFEHYSKIIDNKLIYTYLKNTGGKSFDKNTAPEKCGKQDDFSKMVQRFAGKIKTIDVRNLEMPLPMVTILQELENLESGTALYVHHKKIPQFLFPELQEKNFSWLIQEEKEGEVKLIIYK